MSAYAGKKGGEMPKKKSEDVSKLSELKEVEFITTGIDELDKIAKYPRGRVTQIYGLPSVGKTTIMVRCLAAISKSLKVLYIDVENALNVDRIKSLGADVTKIDYCNYSILEDVAEVVRKSIPDYDIIIIDSVAMLIPRAEYTGNSGEPHVGLKPRLLGQFLRQVERDLAQSRCALLLVNQMRKNLVLYGDPYVLPGGLQLKFSSSLMIQLGTTSKDKIMVDGQQVGHWVHARVTKTKVSTPFLETKFKIIY